MTFIGPWNWTFPSLAQVVRPDLRRYPPEGVQPYHPVTVLGLEVGYVSIIITIYLSNIIDRL